MEISKIELRLLIQETIKSTVKYNSNPRLKGGQRKLPDNLQKAIIDKKEEKKESHHDIEESDSPHLKQYGAPQGSKRDKQLDDTKADLASKDPKRVEMAYRRRERMERQERDKNESIVRLVVRHVLSEDLSKKTKATLAKKAKERGFTAGSVEKEYKKGLAAWATSGSRKGMSQHQWAMARVNSANPSKSWAVVKKSKAKKEAADNLGEILDEAEYQGKKVKVNKPTAIRKGQTGYGKKQEKVYVKDGPKEEDVKVVRFGDPDSEIRRDNPKAKASFDARHNCKNPGPKTKARYWSCKAW
jgi:hypothetical protein